MCADSTYRSFTGLGTRSTTGVAFCSSSGLWRMRDRKSCRLKLAPMKQPWQCYSFLHLVFCFMVLAFVAVGVSLWFVWVLPGRFRVERYEGVWQSAQSVRAAEEMKQAKHWILYALKTPCNEGMYLLFTLSPLFLSGLRNCFCWFWLRDDKNGLRDDNNGLRSHSPGYYHCGCLFLNTGDKHKRRLLFIFTCIH